MLLKVHLSLAAFVKKYMHLYVCTVDYTRAV